MTLEFQILVPDEQVLTVRVASIQVADATGRFGLHRVTNRS